MTPVLATRALHVGYGDRSVGAIPDTDFGPGQVWLVTGPNGSGKSTLLKTLAGLLPPVSGRMAPSLARGRGGAVFVHSTPFLFRGTVEANLKIAGAEPAALDEVVQSFGLTDRLATPLAQLSHGLRQRAAIARAAVRRADLTLIVAAHRPAGLEGLPTQTITLGR